MQPWNPEPLAGVIELLGAALDSLPPDHRHLLTPLLIEPRQIRIADGSGDGVWAVAARGRYVLYWEDVEEGWEWQQLDQRGELPARGCNQFQLSHITHQLFGPASPKGRADV